MKKIMTTKTKRTKKKMKKTKKMMMKMTMLMMMMMMMMTKMLKMTCKLAQVFNIIWIDNVHTKIILIKKHFIFEKISFIDNIFKKTKPTSNREYIQFKKLLANFMKACINIIFKESQYRTLVSLYRHKKYDLHRIHYYQTQ